MKKEAVFEVMQTLGKCNDALFDYMILSFPAEIRRDEYTRNHMEEKSAVLNIAFDDLARRRGMALLVCNAPFTDVIDELQKKMRTLMYEIEKDDGAYESEMRKLRPLIAKAYIYGRKELGTAEVLEPLTDATPLASGALVVPGPVPPSQNNAEISPDKRA